MTRREKIVAASIECHNACKDAGNQLDREHVSATAKYEAACAAAWKRYAAIADTATDDEPEERT